MNMYRLLCTVLVTFSLWLLPAWGEAAEHAPLRVAQVPLVVTDSCWQVPSQAVQDTLERKIDRALHVPLNGVLQAVTFLPEKDCEQALDDAYAALGRRARLRDVVRHMGTQLDADLVVVPVLTGYEQYTHFGWHWERGPYLHSYAAVTLGIYDRRTDEAFSKVGSRMFDDEYAAWGEVATLVQEAMDQALQEAGLHTRLMAGTKNK